MVTNNNNENPEYEFDGYLHDRGCVLMPKKLKKKQKRAQNRNKGAPFFYCSLELVIPSIIVEHYRNTVYIYASLLALSNKKFPYM